MTPLARINTVRPSNASSFRHAETFGRTAWTNLALAFAVVGFLLYYVMQANLAAADGWRLRDAQDRLSEVRQERDTLIAQQTELEDRTMLEQLARENGFTDAGTAVYLIEPDSATAAR